MKTIPLGDVCKVGAGQAAPKKEEFSDHGRPFVRAGSLEALLSGSGEGSLEKVSPETARAKRLKLYPKDTVLFAKSGMSATLGRVYRLKEEAHVVSHLATLEPTGQYDPKYLTHWMRANPPSNLINDPAYPSIRLGDVESVLVPDLTLEEQSRIATILDKADAIRRKRQKALTLADDFLRATFLEMFGNPSQNPKEWPCLTIRELIESVRYGSSAKADKEVGALPILRMGNITYEGGWNFDDLKYIDLSESDFEKYTVKRGDLLFNRTNSKELVGKTAVFEKDEPYAFAGYLVRARTNGRADPYYIAGYLNSGHGKATLRAICKSIVGMANINAQEFQDIPILVPPIALQKRYREIIDSVQNTKRDLIKAINLADDLFASLSQRAFRGEL